MSEQPPISTPPHPYPGKLIIVEGIDGSGKSTQLLLLHKWLESKGHKVFFTEWNSSELVKDTTKRADAFKELASVLAPGTGPISVSQLEERMRAFGDALNAFDDFDNGENSIFAVFDGLIALGTTAEKARGSSLTFTSTKDGAEHTKVFALQAVT